MPFGPYSDFADCVAQNGDKSNPEAFCAWLHHRILGMWPGEMAQHKAEKLETLKAIAEAALSDAFKGFQFQAPRTRTISGIEVFAAGTWTDSSGQTRQWDEGDLEAMVRAFRSSDKPVPLKVGHTGSVFNRKIAEALGLPLELVTGDKGQGQVALGRMVELQRKGDKLVATFANVPEPLADLIEGGQYQAVSSEIELDAAGHPHLVAVALLGAEEPAVTLAPLEAAAVFGALSKGATVLVFQREGKMVKLTNTSPIKDIVAMFQEGGGDALVAIATMLGLDGATATLADILKAIEALKGGAPAEGSEMPAEFSALKETVKRQSEEIGQFKREHRVAKYQRLAEAWKAIPGKPADLAVQIADIEEKAGEKIAETIVAQFEAANKAAAGILMGVGRSKKGPTESGAEIKIKEFEAAGLNHAKAVAKLSKEQPHLFRQYQADNLQVGGNNDGE